ncbi:hypothetical protein B0T18DRAFT_233518 [Schizothecium vesticola]|uniref:Uncharacterized protein n=1 Tax=Schizothecium vesticola TaxID=314040 RepID=A0AA40EDS5_9PEZI|nr:hypothetical protein B0T18DRAFT_233518 [Schizothecium vesticola]
MRRGMFLRINLAVNDEGDSFGGHLRHRTRFRQHGWDGIVSANLLLGNIYEPIGQPHPGATRARMCAQFGF